MNHRHADQSLYRNYISLHGVTARERSLRQTAEDFERLVVDNPSYMEDCKRNGKPQRFMITRSDVLYKGNITAFPDEELYPGDMIECFGEHWIVYQTRVANSVQISGIIWLCNHLFRWQNNTPKIIERWGVLDSGVYSTTKTAGYEVNTPDVQYKIYLPLDKDTKKLYVDKRIATNIRYDANGKQILEVYKLTRVDATSQAYGQGAHLLLLNSRSDDYIAEHDNLEQKICDYIAPYVKTPIPEEPEWPDPPISPEDPEIPDIPDQPTESEPPPELLATTIQGRNSITVGGTRLYRVDMQAEALPMWACSPALPGIELEINGSSARICAADRDELVGQKFALMVADQAGLYRTAFLWVEVVG